MTGAVAGGGTSGFRGHGRGEVVDPAELVSVEDYQRTLTELVREPDPIELRSADSLGLVLAQAVSSPEAIPAFANSAMDGYAVVAADVAAASVETPVRLHVVGEVAAGAAELPTVSSGRCARIMTGAPLPPGADAVVPVEVTRAGGGDVTIHRAARPGEYVRTVGQDVQPGQRLLEPGRRLGPADIGLLAAIGVSRVEVYPVPRVVILSTGDELVPAERRPEPGQIRDANGPMLAAMVRQTGGVPFGGGIVVDDRRALMQAIDGNLGHADMVLLTGGVSAGVYDHVRDVLEALGEVRVAKVAMQPGMPQVAGLVSGVPVVGLPGNPVSAYVSFEVFVRPLLRRLAGRRDVARPAVRAVLTDEVRSPASKRSFLRVRLERRDRQWMATPTGHQGSHVLTSVVAADGLAEIPEEVTSLPAGERVKVHLLVDM